MPDKNWEIFPKRLGTMSRLRLDDVVRINVKSELFNWCSSSVLLKVMISPAYSDKMVFLGISKIAWT